MRNLKPSDLNSVDVLNKWEGSHKDSTEKYQAYQEQKTVLAGLYAKYDSLAQDGCKLQELKPYEFDRDTRNGLYDLYSRDEVIINELAEEIGKDKDGSLHVCPYCGKNIAQELDHYIPRGHMPEYSIHIHNLIPLCHDCNTDKRTLWLNSNSERLFFNAYYDKAPNIDELLEFSWGIININELPQINIEPISINPDDSAAVKAAKSTIEKLELINLYWKKMARDIIFEVVRTICSSYKKYSRLSLDVSTIVETEIEVLKEDASKMKSVDFLKKRIYELIAGSEEFQSWLKVAIPTTADELTKPKGN